MDQENDKEEPRESNPLSLLPSFYVLIQLDPPRSLCSYSNIYLS